MHQRTPGERALMSQVSQSIMVARHCALIANGRSQANRAFSCVRSMNCCFAGFARRVAKTRRMHVCSLLPFGKKDASHAILAPEYSHGCYRDPLRRNPTLSYSVTNSTFKIIHFLLKRNAINHNKETCNRGPLEIWSRKSHQKHIHYLA